MIGPAVVRVEFIDGKYVTHRDIMGMSPLDTSNPVWFWISDVNGTVWYWRSDQIREVKVNAQLEEVSDEDDDGQDEE